MRAVGKKATGSECQFDAPGRQSLRRVETVQRLKGNSHTGPKPTGVRKFSQMLAAGCPGGTFDNSPTLQRWVSDQSQTSPEGTADSPGNAFVVSRPSGTWFARHSVPNAEALGYSQVSLRDAHRLPILNRLGPKPSGINCRTVARPVFEQKYGRGAIARAALLLAMLLGLAAPLQAQQPADEEGRIGFCAVDIFIDSGSAPLAAYQLRFAVTNGVAKIVGIEGGEHPAFRQPPFYDPKAIQSEVAILANFNTAPATELPVGRTRVATIHMQTTGTVPPQFDVKLQTTADAQGHKISCAVSSEKRNAQ